MKKHEALFWNVLEDGQIECKLCPHKCKIKDKQYGFCKVRSAEDGKLFTLHYKQVATGGQIDPIEKKPFYHFLPGSKSLSFGGISCNLKCRHCQNSSLSQEYDSRMLISAEAQQIVKLAKQGNCKSVAWTYNEPTIHFETYYEWSKVIKDNGLYTVMVSNGYINKEPLEKLAPFLDAINIDVKAFTDEFYKKYTKSSLQPVLESCILARKLGLHLEIIYLVIPTLNDSIEEIGRFLDWVIENLGDDVPVHFSRFHPAYKMFYLSATPEEKVIEAVEMALSKKIKYAYAGNLYHNPYINTLCPSCKKVVIKRDGFDKPQINLVNNNLCKFCNETINIIV